MRLLLQIIAIVITGYLLTLFTPWYGIAFAAFVWGYFLFSSLNFVGGFLGAAALWGLKIYLITSSTTNDLAHRVSLILKVNQELYLILITLLIAGLTGGVAALTGGLLRSRREWKRMNQ